MDPLRVFQSMLMATRPAYFSIRSMESSLKALSKETSDFNESHCILEGPLEHISKCVDSVNPFPYICEYSVDHFSVRDLRSLLQSLARNKSLSLCVREQSHSHLIPSVLLLSNFK